MIDPNLDKPEMTKKQKTKFKSHPDSYREQILNHKS